MMNDVTPWIDPELAAAGQLLQNRGLVAPDRTQAPLSEVRAAVDRIGAFLGEGIWETYLERQEQQSDWRAMPILAELTGLPPAHLIVGNLDPLLDDSHRLAAGLKQAGRALRAHDL